MSRTVKIATAAATLLALLAIGSPAVAKADTNAVGGAIGCCRMR